MSHVDDLGQFGWLGPAMAIEAWEQIGDQFQPFALTGERSEPRRVVAWDSWESLGFDINRTILHRQETGDCVSYGAAIVVAAVAAYEIHRLGQLEQLRVPYPPYLYGISRLMPEGGNGRLGRSAGSLGSWMADTIRKYGVLCSDYEGVPDYSGSVADQWGYDIRNLRPFIDEADDHLIRETARIRSIDALVDAIGNGYFCTIASMRGYRMSLDDHDGKSWFVGSDQWPHQMSVCGMDVKPELCFYRRNSWGTAHGRQLDGPDGGGWITAKSLEREIEDAGTECFAFSLFDGWPTDREKPRNYFANDGSGSGPPCGK